MENNLPPAPYTWLAVMAKPRAEQTARLNLIQQGYEVCAPLIRLKKRRRGIWKQVIEPLFPGYVFINVQLGLQNIAPVESTIGCLRLIKFGGRPAPVPDAVMQPLLKTQRHPLDLAHAWELGDEIRINEGPFAGITAIFAMHKGEDRAMVLINALGSQQRLVIDKNSLSATI